jgi:hypothetical protein
MTQPNVTPGAATLIAIAEENDQHRQLATNVALRIALEDIARLPAISVEREARRFCGLLPVDNMPRTFFRFCALWLNSIDKRVREQPVGNSAGWPPVSDFDHAVFLAAGQTLARVVEMASIDAMTFEEGLERIGHANSRDLQRLLVQNYLGNLLQDNFDACDVRLNVRGLPPNTEELLRKQDARQIADTVFAALPDAPKAADPSQIQTELRNLLSRIALEAAATQ